MNARKWIIAAGAAAAVATAVFLLRPRDQPAADNEGAPAAVQGAAPHGSPSASSRPVPAPPNMEPPKPIPGAPPPNMPRMMPYRPAKYLLYSEDRPAKVAENDKSQKVLARIFDLTAADSTQQSKILEFWRVHEDGRRVLWASAYPRVSGPRMLDPEKLEELDSAFEDSLFGVLRPDQKASLSQELPPPGTPRTPPPTMYKDGPHAD